MRSLQRNYLTVFLFAAGCLLPLGCTRLPGRPGPEPEVLRPEQVLDFTTLYKTNCAACHGENGHSGAALPLANPVYLAITNQDTIAHTIANGVSGKLMPPFAKSAGGMLTDQQVSIIAQGIVKTWAKPDLFSGAPPPPYAATLTGDRIRGQQAYISACARCHGADGQGTPANAPASTRLGSIVDPTYLTLLSDQYLRSLVLAGMPDRGMPDFRTDAQQPLTDQQVTDIVAWLAAHRTANPGQPYPTQSH